MGCLRNDDPAADAQIPQGIPGVGISPRHDVALASERRCRTGVAPAPDVARPNSATLRVLECLAGFKLA